MNSLTEQSAKVLAEIDEQLAICENSKPDEIDRALAIQIIERRKRRISSGLGVSVSEQEISAESPILGACAVCQKSLRCLKTAIEGLLIGCDTRNGRDFATAECEASLTALIAQWNENK